MKALTKEKMLERLDITHDPKLFGFLGALITECEEIDTLTVNKLRPMCDAPIDDETILCVGRKYNTFIKVYYDGVHYKDDHNELYNYEDFIGWIPYPVYKP